MTVEQLWAAVWDRLRVRRGDLSTAPAPGELPNLRPQGDGWRSGYTQEELADYLRLSQGWVSRLCARPPSQVSMGVFCDLAELAELEVWVLPCDAGIPNADSISSGNISSENMSSENMSSENMSSGNIPPETGPADDPLVIR